MLGHTVALLALLYCITAAEMKYMRKTSGYTWTYYKTDPETAKELNTKPALDKIQEHKNLLQHIKRLHRNRLLRIIINYRPKGIRNQVRPLKRLLEV
jgi:hypothetical protein